MCFFSITLGTGILTISLSSAWLTQFQRTRVLVVSIFAIYGTATVILVSLFGPNYLLMPKIATYSFGERTSATVRRAENTENDATTISYEENWERNIPFYNASYVSVADGQVRK